MNLPLKFLKQNSESFVPVTAAEAVMVHHTAGVKRLDEVLKFKIEEIVTPVGSGLTSSRSNQGVTITHSNIVLPNTEFKPKILKYDSSGHITDAQDFKQLKVSIQGVPYTTYDGSSESQINFGDDFSNSDGNIQIRWNNLT